METDIRLLPVMFLAGLLAACGGGEDEEDEGPEDADAAGLWMGTTSPDGHPSGPTTVYAAPDGKFYMSGPRGVFIGTGDTNGSSFSATATGWARMATFTNGNVSANFTFSGTVNPLTMSGSYTGGGESGSFNLTFSPEVSFRQASLPAVAGNYVSPASLLPGASPSPYNLTINAGGALSYASSSGCAINGTVSVLDASRNYYGWSATPTGCATATGAISGFGYMHTADSVIFVGTSSGVPVVLGGVTPTAVTPSAGTAEGVYGGTLTGSADANAFRAIILENGDIWAFYGNLSGSAFQVESFVQGTGNSSNGSFSASVRDYFDYPASDATVTATYDIWGTLSGTVSTIDGTVNFSGGQIPGSPYDYNLPASVDAIAGSWTVTDLEGYSYSVDMASNGSFTFAEIGGGCSGTGLMMPRASGKNVFDMTVSFGSSTDCELPNQTAMGIAIAYPVAGGQTQFVAAGTDSARTMGTALFGVR